MASEKDQKNLTSNANSTYLNNVNRKRKIV